MNPSRTAALNPCWSTSSFGGEADTLARELSELVGHLQACKAAHGRLFALHCGAEALHHFVASRFVTTLVVAGLAIGIGSLWT